MGVFALLSFIVSSRLKSKAKKYGLVPVSMTGAEVAQRMLLAHGISDVRVEAVDGSLTDHYDPTSKVIRLSTPVYMQRTVLAASVAAHETGHAVQHAVKMGAMGLRTKLVPIQNASARVLNVVFVVMGLIVAIRPFALPICLGIIVLAYGVFTLFSLVTLRVEIDASKRAIKWISENGIVDEKTRPMAIDALKAAAYTYLVATLSSIATLCYYLVKFMGRRR